MHRQSHKMERANIQMTGRVLLSCLSMKPNLRTLCPKMESANIQMTGRAVVLPLNEAEFENTVRAEEMPIDLLI
ncbi:hypothetical protein Tco_0842463 [Tanacetum coccineum]|uniref:Uncharacterized protein n=1 Tax=Tanacetum coccineum TaxID=301880 RepID=A0ABQ5AZC8_9ASTR